jgi:hypothetical protein
MIEVKAYGRSARGTDLWLEVRQVEEARRNPDLHVCVGPSPSTMPPERVDLLHRHRRAVSMPGDRGHWVLARSLSRATRWRLRQPDDPRTLPRGVQGRRRGVFSRWRGCRRVAGPGPMRPAPCIGRISTEEEQGPSLSLSPPAHQRPPCAAGGDGDRTSTVKSRPQGARAAWPGPHDSLLASPPLLAASEPKRAISGLRS